MSCCVCFHPNQNIFLDSSLSMIAKYGKYYNFASRFSEFESIITSENLIKESLVKWIGLILLILCL